MTRSGTTSRNNFTGTGATDTYSYTFPIVLQTDLVVTTRVTATGVETLLVLTTDYTVTGVGVTAGGTIVLVAGNLASTKKITIRRVVPVTQLADIRNQGTYFPETQENQFDKHNDVDQQQQDDIDRSLRLAETEDAAAINMEITGVVTAKYVPTLNAAADGMEWAALVSGSNIVLPAGLAYMVQTAAGTFTARTFVAGTDITITNTDGQSGNTTINTTLAATLALTTSGNGAALIGVFDTAANFAGTTVEAVLAEIIADYALTTSGNGASKIGIFDTAGKTSATDQETLNVELLANTLRYKSGSFTSDGTNNRTIDTTIAAGTLVSVEVSQLTNDHIYKWHVGNSGVHESIKGSSAVNTNATTTFSITGLDFIVGATGANEGAVAVGWKVTYVL